MNFRTMIERRIIIWFWYGYEIVKNILMIIAIWSMIVWWCWFSWSKCAILLPFVMFPRTLSSVVSSIYTVTNIVLDWKRSFILKCLKMFCLCIRWPLVLDRYYAGDFNKIRKRVQRGFHTSSWVKSHCCVGTSMKSPLTCRNTTSVLGE